MSVLMVVTPWTMLSTRVRHDMSWIVRGVGIEILLVPQISDTFSFFFRWHRPQMWRTVLFVPSSRWEPS